MPWWCSSGPTWSSRGPARASRAPHDPQGGHMILRGPHMILKGCQTILKTAPHNPQGAPRVPQSPPFDEKHQGKSWNRRYSVIVWNHGVAWMMARKSCTMNPYIKPMKTLREIIKPWNHEHGHMKNRYEYHEIVRRHRIRYLMDRCRPGMIQPANLEYLPTYRKPLGISSNHEIQCFVFWPSRGPSETWSPPTSKLSKTLREIMKSWNHGSRHRENH